VKERYAIFAEKLGDPLEKGPIVHGSDVFEHADGDDPIVGAIHLPVVAELESDSVGKARFPRAAAGHFELFP
jgi:hypothetical protein